MSLKWPFLLFAVAIQSATTQSAAAQGTAQRARAAAPRPASGGAVTAFVNVSVIPMDKEQVLAGQTVVVRGDKIAEVGPTAQVKVPAGAARVDGQGKFLIPGLGDMNMRLFAPGDEGKIEDWYAEPRLFCYIANGVTTIRLMAQDTSIQNLTKRVAKGEMLGPRIYVAGTANGGDLPNRLADLRAAGFDFVYIGNNSYGAEQVDSTIVTAARNAKVRLAGDVAPPLDRALKAPYGSIEQLQGYLEALAPAGAAIPSRPTSIVWDSLSTTTPPVRLDESKIPDLAAATQKAGVWNVPMQIQAEMMLELWTGNSNMAKSSVIATRRKLIKALHDAGAGLLLGTGAPTWGSDYGFAVHNELERLVGAGLTPYQALETGTRNIATFLGTQDSTGTIAAGKRADLVLLTANPLEKISNTAKPAGVMVKGQWFTRTKLDAKLKTDACIGR